MQYDKQTIKEMLEGYLNDLLDISPDYATDNDFYKAAAMVVRSILTDKRRRFARENMQRKKIYYLSIEFLLGRSLKNAIYNLELVEPMKEALADYGVRLENLYEQEPDAGLGNGGLGRLAACYLDGLASQGYYAMGYSILYEFGIFRQKIENGEQVELPDDWLPGGKVWLIPRPEHTVTVKFGGSIREFWADGYHHSTYENYRSVDAVPSDIFISGYKSDAIAVLRLWQAKSNSIDMEKFNAGDFVAAARENVLNEAISKVLYPNDNNEDGRVLRLKQQYFLTCATISDIVRRHMKIFQTMENFAEKNAIHINDTHPTLAVPELMRVLLDDFGYQWQDAWDVVHKVFCYTNHTIMREALESWDEGLVRTLLPRIYQVICEIDARARAFQKESLHQSQQAVEEMAVVGGGQVHMANLAVLASHTVNGVSALHSQIIKDTIFHSFSQAYPNRFTGVTNGIAARRWMQQANPELTELVSSLIGPEFLKDFSRLSELRRYADDHQVLGRLARIKRDNKQAFARYIAEHTGQMVCVDSIFDVQVKRLHEYKRQHLNALHILSLYTQLKNHPEMDFIPRTFIFGAKAAPGYRLAKEIIRFIWQLGEMIDADPAMRGRLQVVYLEDYNVSLSELVMPASEVSEQISLAGTEASGTSNMKFMLNGAITLGTLDGANIEIKENVGDENMVLFGMTTPEVKQRQQQGYRPEQLLNTDPELRELLERAGCGFGKGRFDELYNTLRNQDQYMALADYRSYEQAQQRIAQLYADRSRWDRMSLLNIAGAGYFSADRAIREYAENIWHL